jgi:hypothetical protein
MRKAQILTALTADERFFFEHAGFGYYPERETVDEGRARGAIALAAAEAIYMEAHRVADVGCEWEDDPEGFADFDADQRAGRLNDDEQQPERIEGCYIWTGNTDRAYLASLWGIWDADDNYRRVIRAELALESLERLVQIIADQRR